MFYALFLLTFSYLLLCEFKFYDYKGINQINNTENNATIIDNNATNNSEITINNVKITESLAKVSWIEYLLIVWIFSFSFRLIYEVNIYILKRKIKP